MKEKQEFLPTTYKDQNGSNAFAKCTTSIEIKSCPAFALLFACAWMIIFGLYSHTYPIHYSLRSVFIPVSSSVQQELHEFEIGVPKLNIDSTKAAAAASAITGDSASAITKDSISAITEDSASADNIPVFYNLFVKNEADASRVTKIVEEQFNKLLPVHHPIYVNSIGTELNYISETEHQTVLLGHYEKAAEHVTLKSLWNYCQKPEHVNKKVVYMHSKGSFTATRYNSKLRRFLTTGALSEECASMPDDQCNICSSRFSPVPHPHTSGNMWLAKCDYIKNLIDPENFENAMDNLNYADEEGLLACDGRGRYSAEHWAHSHPSVKPCDLYTDSKFTWDYDGIPLVNNFKRNTQLQAFPRFDLQAYIKTDVRYCIGRGASQKFRIDEYKGLYNETAPEDWWGYDFYPEKDDWWPHRDYGWVQLPEEARQELIKLGYSHYTWENRHVPYKLFGKEWNELEDSHRNVLAEIFAYDEKIWNREVRKEKRDYDRIKRSVSDDKPNVSFDRCDVNNPEEKKPWYKKTKEEKNSGKTLREYVYEAPTKPTNNKKRALIIASVPRDETHLVSLWSELECFTDHVDHVIISAPLWGEPYVERVIALAHKHIPHFINKESTIEAKYFLNNRYDVGLWCDAYNSLTPDVYDEYGLINDSVFALRKFSGILDNLEHQNVHMTSLAYSYTYKWNKGYGPEEYWVESVYRGFDKKGIELFNDHSCVAEDHPFFCPEQDDNKACIINNFEHDLAKEYPCDKVQGLYPADSTEILTPREEWKRTWIKNTRYWRMLVEHMGFPIAKVNEPKQTGHWYQYRESKIAWQNDPLMKNCTKFIPWDELVTDLNFEMAKPFYQRKWNNLPPDIQIVASDTLGFTKKTWDRAQGSPKLAGKAWNMLSVTQQRALERLECSKVRYDKNICVVPL